MPKGIEHPRGATRLDPAALHPHPMNPSFFDPPSPDAIAALADDITRNGLREPVEVLPPGNRAGLPGNTVLSGHSRLLACKRLGWPTVPVRVRYDLRDADAGEVERCLLEANQNRRHLDPLAKARVAERLFRIRTGAGGRRLSGRGREELRDVIGRVLGMSGRNLDRYLKVLAAPPEVQNAFRAGRVPLVLAGRAAGLPAKEQADVAARIRGGSDPKGAILAHIPPADGRHVKPADALGSFVRGLRRGRDDLADRVGEVRAAHVGRHAADLRDARRLIDQLLGRLAAG
jgi:ParB-like chromosome segregation protein Spo0J